MFKMFKGCYSVGGLQYCYEHTSVYFQVFSEANTETSEVCVRVLDVSFSDL